MTQQLLRRWSSAPSLIRPGWRRAGPVAWQQTTRSHLPAQSRWSSTKEKAAQELVARSAPATAQEQSNGLGSNPLRHAESERRSFLFGAIGDGQRISSRGGFRIQNEGERTNASAGEQTQENDGADILEDLLAELKVGRRDGTNQVYRRVWTPRTDRAKKSTNTRNPLVRDEELERMANIFREVSVDVEEKSQTLHQRGPEESSSRRSRPQHGKPSELLPQSPLLSPTFHAARAKYKDLPPKPFPSTAESIMRLQDNPWARMLASPIRFDPITWVRLPSALLSEWKLVAHPSDPAGPPWMVPVEILPRSEDSDIISQILDREEPSPEMSDTIMSHAEPGGKGLSEHASDRDTGGDSPSIRLYANRATLTLASQLLHSQKGQKAKHPYLISRRWRDNGLKPRSSKVFTTSRREEGVNAPKKPSSISEKRTEQRSLFIWRQDMPDFYLNTLRDQIVERLVGLAWVGRGGAAGRMAESGGGKPRRENNRFRSVPVLLTRLKREIRFEQGGGGRSATGTTVSGQRTNSPILQPDSETERHLRRAVGLLYVGREPPSSSLPNRGSFSQLASITNLPIFDLPMFLGPEHMSRLRTEAPAQFSHEDYLGLPDPQTRSQLELKGDFLALKLPRGRKGSSPTSSEPATQTSLSPLPTTLQPQEPTDPPPAINDEHADIFSSPPTTTAARLQRARDEKRRKLVFDMVNLLWRLKGWDSIPWPASVRDGEVEGTYVGKDGLEGIEMEMEDDGEDERTFSWRGEE